MRKGIVPLDWKLIGAMLADEEAKDQVDFFSTFINEMRSWGTNHQIEWQLTHIANKLSNADREVLSILCVKCGRD